MNSLRTFVRMAALVVACSLHAPAQALSLSGPLPPGLKPPVAPAPSLFAFHSPATDLDGSPHLTLLSPAPSLESLPPLPAGTEPALGMTPPSPAAALPPSPPPADAPSTFSMGSVSTMTSATMSRVFALGDIWMPPAELPHANGPLPLLAIASAALLLGLQILRRHHRKW